MTPTISIYIGISRNESIRTTMVDIIITKITSVFLLSYIISGYVNFPTFKFGARGSGASIWGNISSSGTFLSETGIRDDIISALGFNFNYDNNLSAFANSFYFSL